MTKSLSIKSPLTQTPTHTNTSLPLLSPSSLSSNVLAAEVPEPLQPHRGRRPRPPPTVLVLVEGDPVRLLANVVFGHGTPDPLPLDLDLDPPAEAVEGTREAQGKGLGKSENLVLDKNRSRDPLLLLLLSSLAAPLLPLLLILLRPFPFPLPFPFPSTLCLLLRRPSFSLRPHGHYILLHILQYPLLRPQLLLFHLLDLFLDLFSGQLNKRRPNMYL